MFEASDDALELLNLMLEGANAGEGVAVRIRAQGTQVNIAPDRTSEDDALHTYQGKIVLVLDPASSETLAGQRLIAQTTAEGKRLSFENI